MTHRSSSIGGGGSVDIETAPFGAPGRRGLRAHQISREEHRAAADDQCGEDCDDDHFFSGGGGYWGRNHVPMLAVQPAVTDDVGGREFCPLTCIADFADGDRG